MCCVSWGLGNYVLGHMATTYSYASMGPTSFGFILMWLTYHSSIKSKGFYRNNPRAIVGLGIRGSCNILYMIFSTMSFKYADKANINQGVIAGLFSVSVIYSTCVFGIFYKERIGFYTLIGMAVIVSGVICVGFK